MKENKFQIRLIQLRDADETLDIYRPYVENTIISFEYEVPSREDWIKRIETNAAEYPWLVCEHQKKIIGYAYGSKHRYRTAYMWSPESTVYLSGAYHQKGIARILYQTLFDLLRLQGYVNVYAGVALPNEKSEKLHEAMGFREIGIFKKIGYKHGAWRDTRWFQLHLIEHPLNPSKPVSISDLQTNPGFEKIMAEANHKLNER